MSTGTLSPGFVVGAICDAPERQVYRDQPTLSNRLHSLAEGTRLAALPALDLLQVDETGATRNGYRYTQHAMQQLAGFLADKLWFAIASLSGQTLSQSYRADAYSVSLAREIFNRALGLRYADIPWQKILVCDQTRHIEGFVTTAYRYVDNAVVIDRMHTGMPRTGGWQFAGSVLLGRRVAVWYRRGDTASLRYAGTQHTYWSGLYIGCGESYSAAAYATPAMFWNRGSSIQTMTRENRVTHYGANFMNSVVDLVQAQAGRVPAASAWVNQVRQSIRRVISDLTATGEEGKREQAKWVAKLQGAKIPNTLAKAIVSSVIFLGSEGNRASLGANGMPVTDGEAVQIPRVDRNHYDFYCRLTETVRELPPAVRERAEQFAHSLITG